MRFVIYLDNASQYRWRLRAANNKIIADSGEGYITKAACKHGIDLVKSTNASTSVVDLTED
ncbi:MAG: DUF1508 domain-containing protein [Gemmatimonadetes bacterium]|nr:DUF1508 domain-containing protein [Gemmatimonadota bacterium]MCY3678631.1 DUF1508 domain-containing protein [Gemmatimonadota bacterium]MYA41588.1 DUF1508 domain-containing protein [Gemmatimonadota bacterium]MYE95097.1 DUF1508 domain-containing protein [Gemmatimonadota bacterium]MYJ09780.1 DUF1508 domain-containing protein [Gemmatimonadota bacterium]